MFLIVSVMIKSLLLSLSLLAAVPCLAEEVNVVKIDQNASSVNYPITNVLSLKFTADDLTVTLKDGSVHNIPLSDFVSIEFAKEDVSGLVRVFGAAAEGAQLRVCDLSGHVVYEGAALGQSPLAQLRGLYVITLGGETKIVMLK